MDTTALIKRFLLKLPHNELFTTRDVLRYGNRSAVDTCLWEMVGEGELIRVIRGMFMKGGSTRVFTNLEVARAKVESFGRKLVSHPDTYDTNGPTAGLDNENETVFGISGFSSSFMYGKVRIFLRALISRKSELQSTKVGRGVNHLWHKETRESIDESELVWKVRRHWTANQRIDFGSLSGLMPWWVVDHFVEWFVPAMANVFRLDKAAPEPGPQAIPQAELDAWRQRIEPEPEYEDEYVPEDEESEQEDYDDQQSEEPERWHAQDSEFGFH